MPVPVQGYNFNMTNEQNNLLDYYQQSRIDISKVIEDNWDGWVLPHTECYSKRYILCSKCSIMNNDIEKSSGTVTGQLDFFITSDSIEDLKQFWNTKFI